MISPEELNAIEADTKAVATELAKPEPNSAAVGAKISRVVTGSLEFIERIGKTSDAFLKTNELIEKYGHWFMLACHILAATFKA